MWGLGRPAQPPVAQVRSLDNFMLQPSVDTLEACCIAWLKACLWLSSHELLSNGRLHADIGRRRCESLSTFATDIMQPMLPRVCGTVNPVRAVKEAALTVQHAHRAAAAASAVHERRPARRSPVDRLCGQVSASRSACYQAGLPECSLQPQLLAAGSLGTVFKRAADSACDLCGCTHSTAQR